MTQYRSRIDPGSDSFVANREEMLALVKKLRVSQSVDGHVLKNAVNSHHANGCQAYSIQACHFLSSTIWLTIWSMTKARTAVSPGPA